MENVSRSRGPSRALATALGRAGRPVVLIAAMAWVLGSAAPARAHGEAAQEPFLRTQTVTFFDVDFSGSSLRVGAPLVITGKVRLMDAWPATLPDPEVAYLTVTVPGPTFVLTDRRVGGRFIPQSMVVEKGAAYEFRLELAARRPGRWHVHPALAVEGAGTLLGPGRWVEVAPGEGFRNPVPLATGGKVDLETYGTADVVLWHLLTLGVGGLWLLWWVIGRPVLHRILLVRQRAEDRLITRRDHRVSYVLAAAAVLVLVTGNVVARLRHPTTIPHQVYRVDAPEASLPAPPVDLVVENATFDSGSSDLVVNLRVRNHGRVPVRVTSFATSLISFGTAASDRPLSVSPDKPILPGKTTRLALSMRDPLWRDHHLVDTRQTQISIAGLLFLRDEAGTRTIAEVRAFVVPRFFEGTNMSAPRSAP